MGTSDAAHPKDGKNLEAVNSGRSKKIKPAAGKQPQNKQTPLQDVEQIVSHNPLTGKPKAS